MRSLFFADFKIRGSTFVFCNYTPSMSSQNKVSFAGLLIALGIIYGDIGTSPLYVLNAITSGKTITKELVIGSVSLIIWTLTLQTTIKYVILTLNADNRGEGGIFSLFALVRRRGKWLVLPAMLGGAALLADGMITPPISVTSAVEGLKQVPILSSITQNTIVGIVIGILSILFFIQQFGTEFIGKFFGPVMACWFIMLAALGSIHLGDNWEMLKAFNPYYGIELLIRYEHGFYILGGVFLCTTGAEALYSDLGHCGKWNIRNSWVFVKTCLILNYLGQGAWLLSHYNGKTITAEMISSGFNPFYGVMPDWFLYFGIAIATAAAIIASQALISGSFTLISEAIRLNLWPKASHKISHRGEGSTIYSGYKLSFMCGMLRHCALFSKGREHGSCLWVGYHAMHDCHFHTFFKLSRDQKNKTHFYLCVFDRLLNYRG